MDSKVLQCDFCRKSVGIQEASFPEDLYDLMNKYNIDQLIWLCGNCKERKRKCMLQLLSVAETQNLIYDAVRDLTKAVKGAPFQNKPTPDDSGNLSLDNTSGEYSDDCVECPVTSSDVPQPSSSANDLKRSSSFVTRDHIKGGSISRSPLPPANEQKEETCMSQPVRRTEKNHLAILKDILSNKIKIQDHEMKSSKEAVLSFLKDLVEHMQKKSALFRRLYSRIYPTGSSFEGLRICDANEFDVNCVLKLPLSKDLWMIEYMKDRSWAECRLDETSAMEYVQKNDSSSRLKLYQEVKKHLLNKEGYFMPDKVRNWMQSVIVNTLPAMNKGQYKDVHLSSHGPAKTLTLTTDVGYKIDIDFVPALEFNIPCWPESADLTYVRSFFSAFYKKFWFMVPKDYYGSPQDNVTVSSAGRMWRIQVPEIEKHILYNKPCANSVIKLFKLLRDNENWKFLASYFIKTVVIHVIIDNPSMEDWTEKKLVDRYMSVFRMLYWCMENKKIPSILYPDMNYLEKQKETLLENTANRMKKMIKQLEDDFSNVKRFYP